MRPVRWVTCLVVCVACATPVRVERADPRAVHRQLTANVLTTGRPSDRSLQVLERLSLRQPFAEDPAGTLAILHRDLAPTGDQRRLFALAELSFYLAEQTGDRARYFMSAVYAYALLFPGDAAEDTPDPTDPRYRTALELYNRGVTRAIDDQAGRGVQFRSGEPVLPIGQAEIVVPEEELDWAGHELSGFISSADVEVHGLRNRYRRPGIGAPLSAELGPERGPDATPTERLLPGLRVPITLFVRFEQPRRALREGRIRARVELHAPDEAESVWIDGREVPLEFETTSSLASSLADVTGTGPIEEQDEEEGLLFLHPYRPDHIPVVLVHGTASSPARWAELVNELENDRIIWERYQLWLFFWRRIARVPLDQLDLDPDVRETLRMSSFFTPEPFVERLIFVCTPHHGSYLASFSLAGAISDLVAAPSNLTQMLTELVTRNRDKLVLRNMARLPTSIDNMTPGNPFIKTLAQLPLARGVQAHSIIAVRGDGPFEGGSDGVVRYRSAHLEGVDSELVVRSSHSAQGRAETIEEIRRILILHAPPLDGDPRP